jgi:hypothetical protein
LRLRLDRFAQPNENRPPKPDEGSFARLKGLLVEERMRNAELMQRCTKLEMQNDILLKYRDLLKSLREESQ